VHYYTWNIGDYSSHASHLNVIEDCAYRRLLDRYYLSEEPIALDVSVACRLIGMREHQAEVEIVLKEFFTQTESGWVNKRAEQEIAHFKGKIDQASRAGKASAERRMNARSTPVQRTSNQPITNNQEPLTINQDKTKARFSIPNFIPQDAWQGFYEMRKTGKGVFTERAASLIIKQLTMMHSNGQDVAAILDQSTANGWKSIYPLKTQGATNGKFNVHAAGREGLARALAEETMGARSPWEISDAVHDPLHKLLPGSGND
jgi:uncharacterized protein YdaU (DUF1376 family)